MGFFENSRVRPAFPQTINLLPREKAPSIGLERCRTWRR